MSPDALLIQQTLTGDPQAFEQLVRKYHRSIYALSLRWVRRPEDAQEIVQDVFLKAYQNLISLRRPESFNAWLHQIARHECQNRKRRKSDTFQPLPSDVTSGAPPADEQVLKEEALENVSKAMENLPDLDRELLKARYLDDVPYGDLQAAHGLSYKAITMRILKAKRKVRKQVEKIYAETQLPPPEEAMGSLATATRQTDVPERSPQKGVKEMRNPPFHFTAPMPAYTDRKGKFGYINRSGEMIIPPQFDRAMSFSEGLGRVGIGDKQGYIDETGKFVIPLKFDDAYPFSEGLAAARIGETYGYIDRTGEFVIPPRFDDADPFHEGFATVQVDEKWGYIDKTGAYIVEPRFDRVWYFADGMAPVREGDLYGYIDQTGAFIWWPEGGEE